VVESVYSAVRTDSLYKVDYIWSLKGSLQTPQKDHAQSQFYINIYHELIL